MFKLGIRNDLGYTRCGMLLGLKGQGHWVSKSILHPRTAIHRHSLGGVTSRRLGIELSECLLVLVGDSTDGGCIMLFTLLSFYDIINCCIDQFGLMKTLIQHGVAASSTTTATRTSAATRLDPASVCCHALTIYCSQLSVARSPGRQYESTAPLHRTQCHPTSV